MQKIRELRLKAGMTQEQLAKRLNLRTKSTVSKWETGESVPGTRLLINIAKILGCEINDLFDCEKEKTN